MTAGECFASYERLEQLDAEASYLRALELVGNDSERRFLTRRLREVRAAIP